MILRSIDRGAVYWFPSSFSPHSLRFVYHAFVQKLRRTRRFDRLNISSVRIQGTPKSVGYNVSILVYAKDLGTQAAQEESLM